MVGLIATSRSPPVVCRIASCLRLSSSARRQVFSCRPPPPMEDVKLSKGLVWLLRHNAVKEGLLIDAEGYVDVNEVLKHRIFKKKCNVDDIKNIVENNDKQRFKLRNNPNTNQLQIKATQGHSLKSVGTSGLEPILKADDTHVIHGTYFDAWQKIKLSGLSRMNRNHIHFTTSPPKCNHVISGMRTSSQIYIYIDVDKAILAGIKFFKSENGVILSPGNDQGFIEKKYFSKVVSASHNQFLTY
ncbi:tRNA 2'-phosphotransferase 1-like isoform X1 [Arctopsyche grandis]|uniref:tRNA 2'-phosphotransferase 1-like isoform X1 n=1 Tax=Arctopsyche grandis TaxID=121162 RepID=UPI00406D7143